MNPEELAWLQPLRDRLHHWLADRDAGADLLADWLCGYDLPPVGHEEHPYRVLLLAAMRDDRPTELFPALAARLAQLLDQEPDVTRPGRRPAELLYNALMLAAGLRCGEELIDALTGMLERATLDGEWLGIDLRTALATAIIANQIDNRHEELWLVSLRQPDEPNRFLPLSINDAIEGLRFMRESPDRRGQPALGALGKGLLAASTHLSDACDRRPRFRQLVNRIRDTYPGRPEWDVDVIRLADEHSWPVWAVESVPTSLCVLNETKAYLWWPVAGIHTKTNLGRLQTDRSLCRERVVYATMDEAAKKYAMLFAGALEPPRRENPLRSDSSVIGVIGMALLQLLQTLHEGPHKMEAARAASRWRYELLSKYIVLSPE